MKTKVFSILTQKGGVGKTTTSIHLSDCFANKSKKVLLIDFDSQCNLTLGMKIDDNNFTVKDFLEKKGKLNFSQKGNTNNIFVLVGSPDLENISLHQNSLKESLAAIDGVFDYVIIDCPPKPLNNSLTLGEIALFASDYVVSPIEPEEYSISGVYTLYPSIMNLKKKYNLKLEYLGFFFNRVMVNSRDFKDYYSEISNSIAGESLFKTFIRQDANINKAKKLGKTIFEYSNQSRASLDFKNLHKEIIKKIQL